MKKNAVLCACYKQIFCAVTCYRMTDLQLRASYKTVCIFYPTYKTENSKCNLHFQLEQFVKWKSDQYFWDWNKQTDRRNLRYIALYRVIQEERSVFLEITVPVKWKRDQYFWGWNKQKNRRRIKYIALYRVIQEERSIFLEMTAPVKWKTDQYFWGWNRQTDRRRIKYIALYRVI